jgi:hypothetical protein
LIEAMLLEKLPPAPPPPAKPAPGVTTTGVLTAAPPATPAAETEPSTANEKITVEAAAREKASDDGAAAQAKVTAINDEAAHKKATR